MFSVYPTGGIRQVGKLGKLNLICYTNYMKVTVFGAGGKTGVEVVNYLTEQGFKVVAFLYRNDPALRFPASVSVQLGDVTNYDAVLHATTGTDAVISVLGHIKNSDPLMQTKGITNIVKAMEEVGITRLISLTGTGARENGDAPSIIDRVLNFAVQIVDPARVADGIAHVDVLKQSRLNWTVVRVLKLGNSNKDAQHYNLTTGGPAELYTSRKKVAKVMVDLLNNNEYIRNLPVISG